MENEIHLDYRNAGSFYGPLASKYAYKPELRSRLDELVAAVKRNTTNRFFVLEGTIVRAAQSTRTGALNYMSEGRVLVVIQGCGKCVHVVGTNGGTMPCGATLTQLDGTVAPYLCATCEAL